MIVVDVCLYRDGLERALAHWPGVEVVGSLTGVDEAGHALARIHPDVVLLDPGTDPDLVLGAIVAEVSPGSRIVALGVREEEDDVVRCAEAGMSGYVPRDASIAELVAVIETAARGELRCAPHIAAGLFRRVGLRAEAPEPEPPALTRREGEIVRLIDEGLSNKQIAHRLKIEVSTVKNHVHNLLRKLDAPRRSVAAARVRWPQRGGERARAREGSAPPPGA